MTTQRKQLELSEWRREAETVLLAGMLRHYHREPDLVENVLATFQPDMWLEPRCRIAVRAMLQMNQDGEEPRLDRVCARVMGEIDGAAAWLADVFTHDGHISPFSVQSDAERLYGEHMKGMSAVALTEALQIARNPACDIGLLQEVLSGCLARLELAGVSQGSAGDQLAEYFTALEAGKPPLVSTPWDGLNFALAGGVSPGELVVIGARPSVGKTAFAANWFWHVAACGGNAVFFSLEMSRAELLNRITASLAGIDSRAFRQKLGPEDLQRAKGAGERMLGKGLFIDDRGMITPAEMRRVCKARAKLAPLSLVVVDYLQLVTPDEKAGNREQEISSISRKCKLLAKDLNAPVLLLSQLNRESEKLNREPKLSDLRESGAIEQDADAILLLHQDKVETERCRYRKMPEPLRVSAAKGRNTGCGFTKLVYNKSFQRIYYMDGEFKAALDKTRFGHPTFADNGL